MRSQINSLQLTNGISELVSELYRRLDEKGYGSFASRHEILGAITEEYKELIDAVQGKYNNEQVMDELLDIAVGALFGYVCLKEKTVDW